MHLGRILIIEDQIAILQSLKKGLEENGFLVETCSDGADGLALACSDKFQVIIADIMLPSINGIEICKQIREKGMNTPIMFLSALDSVEDKIAGLNAGGDDYLAKPFSFEEVLARVKVLMRRQSKEFGTKIVTIGSLEINHDTKQVNRAGSNINLTKKEFRLLEFFVANQGKLVTKSDIAEKVWDLDFDTGTNIVEVYVNYLRNKLDKGFDEKMIHTKFGLGYIFNPHN